MTMRALPISLYRALLALMLASSALAQDDVAAPIEGLAIPIWKLLGALLVILAIAAFVAARRRINAREDLRKQALFDAHTKREALRADFDAELKEVVTRSSTDDLSFVVLRRLLAHIKRLFPQRMAAAVVNFSGGEERLVAPDPRAQAEFEAIVKAHEQALKNVSWSGNNVVLNLRAEPGRWAAQTLAALPIPIPKPGFGMLMISREPQHAFSPEELDEAADFAQRAIDSMELAKHEANSKTDREVDKLTGVYNRQAVELRAVTQFTEAMKNRTNMSAVWVELDQFRSFIKDHGPERSDSVLKVVAQRIQRALDRTQMVGRWDQHEFVILMPAVPEFQAEKLSDTLCKALAREISLHAGDAPLSVTASIGFAAKFPSDTHFSKLMDRAAKGKDQAKFQGGNAYRRGSDEPGGVNFQKF
jgi:diguanylate cyclase (GGDEF)-like protein